MNDSLGNEIGMGVGPDQKFVLRSRKVLALLLVLLPAFGVSPDAVKQFGTAGELVLPAIAALLLLWSMIRADGAKLTWKPKLSWLQKLKLARLASKVMIVGVCLVPLAGCSKNPDAQMTPAQCRKIVSVAKLGIGECDRLGEPEKVSNCIHYATLALELAEVACGFVPEPETEE